VNQSTGGKAVHDESRQDPLTGLGDRTTFEDALDSAIAKANRGTTSLAVLFLDLNRFREINDRLGHSAGDQLLQAVAQRIHKLTGECDVAARMGGDEFGILLGSLDAPEDAAVFAALLLDAMSVPIKVEHQSLVVSANIGIASFPGSASSRIELMQQADAALYEVKKAGEQNSYLHFSPAIQSQLQRHVDIEHQLRLAIAERRIQLLYQPQFRFSDKQIVGAEALLRLKQIDGHLLEADKFITTASKTGLIVELGQWVSQQVCEQIKTWDRGGVPALSIAVNISSRELNLPNFLNDLEQRIERAGIDPRRIELDLAEANFLDADAERIALLQAIGRVGFHIAIDDYGTGYSSPRHLKSLPVQRLKIDTSFICGAGSAVADPVVVQAIIDMAHSLGLEVIAEGVETIEQFEYLRALGCDYGQGFLIGKPMSAEALHELICRRQQGKA
tara:strand:+ start:43063 stop:44400 length:1338 start_codon:yes stop_codon:yes gene_type:complete